MITVAFIIISVIIVSINSSINCEKVYEGDMISNKRCLNTLTAYIPSEIEQSLPHQNGTINGCNSYVDKVGGKQEIDFAGGCSNGAILHAIPSLFQHDNFNDDQDTGWKTEIIADNLDNKESESMTTFTYNLSALNGYGSCTVTLYRDDYYAGNMYVPYSIGDYRINQLLLTGLKVLDNEKCIVELFKDNGYSGWKTILNRDPTKHYHINSLMALNLVYSIIIFISFYIINRIINL